MVTSESIYDAKLAEMDKLDSYVSEIVSKVQNDKYWIGEKSALTWGEVLEVVIDRESDLAYSLHSVYLDGSHNELWLLLDEVLRELATNCAIEELR